ncbi:hypothetical protein Cgig2_017855 [Carnegiea gigantea]|uniref:Uncharacterized protein n=1 Tax=Carnegiea gigantea TaxID=171969 RepID=A0A9Q1KYY6_9CARY|nr:hypothetical protein Cgig2_017855 [Carnegiea gigantea]
MEATNSARPLPHFDYVPTTGCEPSHQCARVPSPHSTEREWEASRSNRSDQAYMGNHDQAHVSFVENKSLHSPSRGMKSVLRKLWLPSPGVMRRAQLRGMQQVLTAEQGARVIVPTMVFGGREAPRFASPHDGPLVVEMKVASAIVRRILIDTERSVDIITWDYLKKLTYPGWDIVPLVHPILCFGRQKVNLTGMVHLHLSFGEKLKARNLEVDFPVVDVPTAYNIILGRPTLH